MECFGSVGQVMWNSNGGQDGHPLLHVVLLALAVNHKDGDVIAAFFQLYIKDENLLPPDKFSFNDFSLYNR